MFGISMHLPWCELPAVVRTTQSIIRRPKNNGKPMRTESANHGHLAVAGAKQTRSSPKSLTRNGLPPASLRSVAGVTGIGIAETGFPSESRADPVNHSFPAGKIPQSFSGVTLRWESMRVRPDFSS
jgi:hypothetical protein